MSIMKKVIEINFLATVLKQKNEKERTCHNILL